jgi:transcriptional regulator with XRE-family HTH domain
VGSVFERPWTGRHLLVTQRLRQRRDELGLTQKQVVSRLGRVGVSTTNRALSSLEHGSGLDVAKLPELAQVLDCTVTYLVGLTDDPHSWTPDSQVARHAVLETPNAPTFPAPPIPAAAGRRSSGILGTSVPLPDRGRRFG